MPLLLRAIITGFGYKLGAELGRYVATRVGLVKPEQAAAEEKTEDIPDGITLVSEDEDVEEEDDAEATSSESEDEA
jgi:hypothetical protein